MTHVFHSFPKWQLSGVNTWSANLIRESAADAEFDHSVLFTGISRQPQPDFDVLGLPHCFLEVDAARRRKDEWAALKRFLEANAPCIYIPQYDFHRSAVVPALSPDVKVCAVVHSDEECYYDLLKRIGYACDAIVTVSSYLADKMRGKFPKLAPRVHFIPPGVPALQTNARRSQTGRLELAYCNRLAQYQKRVFDLPEVMADLLRLGADCHLTVTGDGPDAAELRERFQRAGAADCVTMTGRISDHELADVLARSHAFLLVSDFEGLPSSLLEGMACGCVPVTYDIASGVRDAVSDGVNGLLVKHGDPRAFAAAVRRLDADRRYLSSLSLAAVQTHADKFSVRRMATDYHLLFNDMIRRPRGGVVRDSRIKRPRDLTLRGRIANRLGRLRFSA